MDYTFRIGNVNCDPRYVSLRDTLPEGLFWDATIGLDSINSNPLYNPHISFNNYAGTRYLDIDSILVQGDDVLSLTATAHITANRLEEDEVERFDNQGYIAYQRIRNNVPEDAFLASLDAMTLEQMTWFVATGAPPLDTVRATIETIPTAYIEDSTLIATITVVNPLADTIRGTWLEFSYDAGFTYTSFSSSVTGAQVPASLLIPGLVTVAGNSGGTAGFKLPPDTSTYTFKLKAPSYANLEPYIDEYGDTIPHKVADLYLQYSFVTDTANPCIVQAMSEMYGDKRVPYLALRAHEDHASTATEMQVKVPVLKNDTIPYGCTPTLEVKVPPLHGSASVLNDSILYKSDTDFSGFDTLTYLITCGTDSSYANVIIYVAELPDNVSDAECYIDPPSFTFGIKRLTQSTVANVNHYMIPMVGDIDNDGYVEIVAGFNSNVNGDNINTNSLVIYEVIENNVLRLQQTLSLGAFTNNVGSNMAIANVDGGPYAAIFVATGSANSVGATTGGQAANLQRKLVKYIYNGTQYVIQPSLGSVANCPQYSNITQRECAQPMFADFNGDGIPEVVVLDKIYNARTLDLLADGGFLNDTYPTANYQFGLGYGGHWNNNYGTYRTSHMAIGDLDNDGIPEIIGGHCAYKVKISSTTSTAGNSYSLWKKCSATLGPNGETQSHPEVRDGATAVADMDNDGFLDVVVTSYATSATTAGFYIWNPRTGRVMHSTSINNLPATQSSYGPSRPLVGDIDGDKQDEVVFLTTTGTGSGRLYAFEYNPLTKTIDYPEKWYQNNLDNSGSTTLTLFDFNNDGAAELVYRDVSNLYILQGVDGDPAAPSIGGLANATANEYPIIANVNDDEAAEIIATGAGRLQIFTSSTSNKWAPARKVWNQVPYNAVNVNEDLTIPRFPINPATFFAGKDGIFGTFDDVRPFNNFLQQQTALDTLGVPLWLTPDAIYKISSPPTAIRDGDSIRVEVCIDNIGDAALGKPIFVSFYRDSISTPSFIKTDSINDYLQVGDNTCLVTYLKALPLKFADIVIRLNDRRGVYPYQRECHQDDSVRARLNPALSLYVRKNATIGSTQNNGRYQNPVAILYNENIKYEISAFNANVHDGATFIIRDTLPAYLDTINLALSTPPNIAVVTSIPGSPLRKEVRFEFPTEPKLSNRTVSFYATPMAGTAASQPLFVNYAVAETDNYDHSIYPPSGPSGRLSYRSDTATYHQGAGIAIVTFSASVGGIIFGSEPQAVDYRTTARTGVVVVPNGGYKFVGWSHSSYTSLRGDVIPASDGIMSYDTLIIYGDVKLRAEFAPDDRTDNATVDPLLATSPQHPSIWASGGELFVNIEPLQWFKNPASGLNEGIFILRIYTTDGILYKQQTILNTGITTIKLPRGIYICTLNNGIGTKVVIN
jgi:hypothetical protein